MKYTEAMEFAKLLDFDPSVAYKESFDRAIAAEESFKAQMAFESTLGAFVDDDEYRTENIRVATEAANAVVDTLKKIATWFKNLLVKFKAFIRKIIFKARVTAADKAVAKMSKNAKAAGSAAPAKGVVTLSDEELEKYNAVFKDLDQKGIRAGFIGANMNAMTLANLCKMIASRGDECEKKLADAMKNPSADVSVKDLNENCKLIARAMKITTSLLNKAVKAGAVQSSEQPAEKVDANPEDVTDKNGNPVKQGA